MSVFNIDCELDYDVLAQTLFLFNIGAQTDHRQHVVSESVSRKNDVTAAGTHELASYLDRQPVLANSKEP